MRAIRVASAALLGVIALTSCTPAAVADDDHYVMSTGYGVQPATIAAGGLVTLQVDRKSSGCNSSVKVSSAVFETVTISSGSSSGTATIDLDAKVGAVYRVTFSCGGVSATKDLTITDGRQVGPQPLNPQPLPPNRGAHAGAGGSMAGFDLEEIGLGAALIAGSTGAAYRFYRRRSGDGA